MEEQGLELYQGRQGRGEKPAEVVEKAKEQARVLSDIINQVGLYSVIQGNKYIRYEAWQTLANFVGITPFVEWTKEIQRDDTTIGYECRALALRGGETISAAEAQCSQDEHNWAGRELWQIRSMAQTRACAKVLRTILGWIVVLAGYQATPVEEMTEQEQEKTVYTHCPIHDAKWMQKGNNYFHKDPNGRWCNPQKMVVQTVEDKSKSGEIDQAQFYEWVMGEYGTQFSRLSHEKMLEVYERLDEIKAPGTATEEQKTGEEQGRML